MQQKDKIEQFLDRTLAEAGETLPREGLEHRILANLAAQEDRQHWCWRWWWAVPVLASILLVVAFVARRQPKPEVKANAVPKAVEANGVKPTLPTTIAVHHEQPKLAARKRGKVDRSQHEEPRLAKFPSGDDSNEVHLLMQFVRRNPETARELVREQEEFQAIAEQKLGGGD